MVCPTCKAYTVYGLSRAADLGMIRVVDEQEEAIGDPDYLRHKAGE
jgi:hypothetical protein